MAKYFAAPVSDVQETSLRATAMPTKAATEWGIHVWEDWAKSVKCAITIYCTLKCEIRHLKYSQVTRFAQSDWLKVT